MDPHCGNISLALYRQERPDGTVGVVHTYSRAPGAGERADEVARSMTVQAGLNALPGETRAVRFACDGWHEAAARRCFLEACKLGSGEAAAVRPLAIDDRGTGQRIEVEPLGRGAYRVHADAVAEGTPSRAPAVARGLAKLGELEVSDDDPTVVRFDCGAEHDALVGLLLPRALNVRAVLREEESKATRGVLTAPSAKQE